VKASASAIVGGSEAIDDLRAAIARLAAISDPVLVAGETGAGKERVSRALHDHSARAKGPFVAVNMATLAPGTAAAQLFGHVKGAFTGADRAVAGLFAQADGGTLLLDEIFDTPAEVQPMLLRALDAGEILPLGADAPRTIDVRVIAATDADLDAAQTNGAFRPQLFHRLAVHRLIVPPLRARIDDVGRLLASFLRRELGELPVGATPWLPTAAMRACATYTWPGNVRELDAVARRLALVGRTGSIALADAMTALDLEGADEAETGDGVSLVNPAARLTRFTASPVLDDDRLIATLAAHRWQTAATARALGISKTTLYARMDACPQIRKARDLEREEIEATGRDADGDLDAMAETLRVSRRGLQLRMRELGMP
jgi:two-component system nitrogen regulation response regulator GlnG